MYREAVCGMIYVGISFINSDRLYAVLLVYYRFFSLLKLHLRMAGLTYTAQAGSISYKYSTDFTLDLRVVMF